MSHDFMIWIYTPTEMLAEIKMKNLSNEEPYLGGLTETKRLIPFINKPKNGNAP